MTNPIESFQHYCIGKCSEGIIRQTGRIKFVQKWKLTMPNGVRRAYSSKEEAEAVARKLGMVIDGDHA